MANLLNIQVNQGATFSYALLIKDENGEPQDLTGYTFTSQAREKYDSVSAAFSFSFSIRNQTTQKGYVDWTLAANVLTSLSLTGPKDYLYDVEMNSGSAITRILEGIATVKPEVTK